MRRLSRRRPNIFHSGREQPVLLSQIADGTLGLVGGVWNSFGGDVFAKPILALA